MAINMIQAEYGAGLILEAGERLRVIDVQGSQVCDLVAYRLESPEDCLSNARTFDYTGSIYLSVGDVLWSSASCRLLTIVTDDVGRHDFLYPACSTEMYRLQYGIAGYHRNCTDNLTEALHSVGVEPRVPLCTPFNIFQNALVQIDGTLKLAPPISQAGQSIVFRAETNLAVALSACAASICNGGTTKPIAFEVLPKDTNHNDSRHDEDDAS